MKISKKILDLLKSGNFTIAYHDREYCALYKGHLSYDDIEEDSEITTFDASTEGYANGEVIALAKALGGKVVSV